MARRTDCFAAGLALCGLLWSSIPAAAQVAPSGGSFLVAAVGVRGNASAYDSKNNVFLAVGGHGSVTGRLVKPDGTFASAPFQIDPATGYPQYPSVAYSPDADSGRGAYLVTWHQNIGPNSNFVHARLVSATGVLLGTQLTLGSEPTWWEAAPMIDYATTSQVFMVTWRIGAYQIRAARVSLTGQNLDAGTDPLGRGILVTTSGGERDPSVAYNPENDTFLVSYADFLGGGHAYARLVSASTGAVGAAQPLGGSTSVYTTDATFSTSAHKFLVGWVQLPGGATGRLVNADGTPSGNPIPLSTRFGTYDSFGIAYNAVARTSLAIGQDLLSAENGGVEVSDAGVPGPNTGLTSAGGPVGNFYPQLSASTTEAKWLVTTAHNFSGLVAQFATATPQAPPTPIAPKITTQPVSIEAPRGGTATFTAAASGSPAPTVQWEVSADGGNTWGNVPGATSTTFPIVAIPNNNGKLFRAHFTNSAGQALSVAVLLMVGTVTNDFDGDGKADLVVWRPSSGTFYSLMSSANYNYPSANGLQWGQASLGDVSFTGDFDGDGVSDPAVWRASTGAWFWLTSMSAYANESSSGKQWGSQAQGDIPMLADIDGDGRSDLIVWRASTGTWFWLTSSTGYAYDHQGQKQWGAPGDLPLIGDFDGDRKADFAVWRPSTGVFFWLTSSTQYAYGASGQAQWGIGSQGDMPFLGDIDGDRCSDLVIWRPSIGMWFMLTSRSGFSYGNAISRPWGSLALGDVPLLNDFDGDGVADPAVWRATTGTWYWLKSSTGFAAGSGMQWGIPGDVPMVK